MPAAEPQPSQLSAAVFSSRGPLTTTLPRRKREKGPPGSRREWEKILGIRAGARSWSGNTRTKTLLPGGPGVGVAGGRPESPAWPAFEGGAYGAHLVLRGVKQCSAD